MAVLYTQQHRTVPAIFTQAGKPYHPGLVRWLGYDANLQALYTSRQAVNQWWPAGATTTVGILGEQSFGTWLMIFPLPFTRLVVELGGYAVAGGGTVWRLYSSRTLPLEIAPQGTPASATIVTTTHAFTAPAYVTARPFSFGDDQRRATWLRLTGENLTPSASGRLWTMHVRPAPDTPD